MKRVRKNREFKDNLIVVFIRYAISIPSLATVVVLRYRIGSDSFAPWFWGEHGRAQNQYAPKPYTWVFSIALLYVWVRSFLVWEITQSSDAFDGSMLNNWIELLRLYWPINGQNLGIYQHSLQGEIFQKMSWGIPLLAITQLGIGFSSRAKAEATSHGRSWLFGWIVKARTTPDQVRGRYAIRGVLEPLLIIGLGFLAQWYGLLLLGRFFWVSAFCILVQANQRNIKKWWKKREIGIDVEEKSTAKDVLNDTKPSQKAPPIVHRPHQRS